MIKIERYQNGEIVFRCKCELNLSLVVYCGEDGTGIVVCNACGRIYKGSSAAIVEELPGRDIGRLKERQRHLNNKMDDLLSKKTQMKKEIEGLGKEYNEIQGLLDLEKHQEHLLRKDEYNRENKGRLNEK